MTRFLKCLFLFISFSLFFAFIYKTRFLDLDFNPPIKMELDDLGNPMGKDWAQSVINTLNARHFQIKSLATSDIKIHLRRVLAKGSLHYENGNLRFMAGSVFGKELDIGSNKEIFWFWSKRIRPQALYYSLHKEDCNERLKPVFSKDWIICCFMFNVVGPHKDVDFFKKDDYLVAKYAINNDLNYIVTLIDYKESIIRSRLLYDLDGNIIAIVNYDQFDELFMPRVVDMYWYEEGITMSWNIEKIELNKKIDDALWEVPDYQPKVNICSD